MSTVSFNPSSLSFGNVPTNSTLSQTVTITNSGSSAQTASTDDSDYTLTPSPAIVPAASGGTAGSIVVTVTFQPAATNSYPATLSCGDGSCTLSGTGIAAVTTTGTGADPNQFQTETAAGLSADTGQKYYQIVVPNFAEGSNPGPSFAKLLDASGSATTTVPALTSASSFLRLGSPPDPTADWSNTPFQNSVNLARLVGDPWVISAAENMSVSGTSITASKTDTSTASSIMPSSKAAAAGTSSASGTPGTSDWSDNFGDGTGNPSITGIDSTTLGYNTSGAAYAVGDGKTWGNAFNTNQDASYFPGFADDTRQRGTPTQSQATGANNTCPAQTNVSNAPVANFPQNRQAETLKLLSKGGWWDHSDGNRVTTTSGDKIEVIQGNYKLVVLGRQPAPTPTWTGTSQPAASDVDTYRQALMNLSGNAFITDVSGGHFQEQYPSPTPCIKTIEYVQDSNGEWTLYQDNGQGNVITRLKGRTVDLFQGPKREAYVGSDDTSVLYAVGYSNPATPNAKPDQSKPASSTNANDTDLRLDPVLISKTWAQSVFTQTGSEGKPVGWNGGNWITDTEPDPVGPAGGVSSASTGDVVNMTWAMRIRNYQGSLAAHVKHIYSETHADEIQSFTFGESSTTINGILNNFSLTLGIVESINIGAMLDVQLGPKSSVCIDKLQFNGTKNVVEGQRTEATAAANRLRGIENSIRNAQNGITGLANDIINLNTRVTNTTTQIDQRVTNLGMAHWNLYAQVNLGV